MLHTNERIIKHKVGLLNLAEELGNVSKACQVMGLSRDTFYRYKQAVEDGGVESLLSMSRRKKPTRRTELMRRPRERFYNTQLTTQRMVRPEPATSFARLACSCHRVVYAASGYDTIYSASNCACGHWKSWSLARALF